MKKIPRIVSGFIAGMLCDFLPAFVEQVLGLPLCRESCPTHFRILSIAVYLVAPFAGAVTFLACTSWRARIVGIAALMLLVGLVTLASHFYQTGFQVGWLVRAPFCNLPLKTEIGFVVDLNSSNIFEFFDFGRAREIPVREIS
ncbi:MAG: hypothetical protein Q7T70_14745 [Polaromonas sp.]|nr:hypothetical protein [Polaromonas sp.]